jgi:hypothetical protein
LSQPEPNIPEEEEEQYIIQEEDDQETREWKLKKQHEQTLGKQLEAVYRVIDDQIRQVHARQEAKRAAKRAARIAQIKQRAEKIRLAIGKDPEEGALFLNLKHPDLYQQRMRVFTAQASRDVGKRDNDLFRLYLDSRNSQIQLDTCACF